MKVSLYFPLTVWDEEGSKVRELTQKEKEYCELIEEMLTKKFRAISVTNISGTYIREGQVVKTQSAVMTMYCPSDKKDEVLAYIRRVAVDIKRELKQESVMLTWDTQACYELVGV